MYDKLFVLQDVKFQMKLDMYDFCTPGLQDKMLPIRRKYKEVEDKKIVSCALHYLSNVPPLPTPPRTYPPPCTYTKALKAKAISEFKAGELKAIDTSKAVAYQPYDFPEGKLSPTNNDFYYNYNYRYDYCM